MNFRSEIRGGFILVTAIEGHKGRSLTNSAEDIVSALAISMKIRGRRILYEDSVGVWDELVHDGERFVDFRHIGGSSADDAISLAEKLN